MAALGGAASAMLGRGGCYGDGGRRPGRDSGAADCERRAAALPSVGWSDGQLGSGKMRRRELFSFASAVGKSHFLGP